MMKDMGDPSSIEDEAAYRRLKEDLERTYGVEIVDEAIGLTKRLVQDYHCYISDDETPVENMRLVLSKACELVVSKVLGSADEKELDRIEYMLRRCLVEHNEVVKEKDPCSKVWLRRLDKEIETINLDLFPFFIERSWGPDSGFPELIQKLEANCHTLRSSLETANLPEIFTQLSGFQSLLHAFLQLLHQKFRIMSVQCSDVKKVVCRLTGIPIAWLHNYKRHWVPSVLQEKLHAMVVGHEHVISDVVGALFLPHNRKKGSGPRLPKAFLFLGPSGVGKTQLVKAMAVCLYGGLDWLIRIDMSSFTKFDLPKLGHTVTIRPYSLILFEKIDKAHPDLVEAITRILACGVLLGAEGGSAVDFTRTIIIMTSSAGAEKIDLDYKCISIDECTDESELINYFNAENFFSKQMIDEAKELFKPELLDRTSGVFVFSDLLPQKIVARLLLREMASSISEQGILVYSTEYALNLLMKKVHNGHETKNWLNANLVPMLSEMVTNGKIGENCAVYVDTLVGSSELSFRVEESTGNVVEDWFFKKCKRSFRKLTTGYRSEREVVNLSLKLKIVSSELMDYVKDGRLKGTLPEAGIACASTLMDMLFSFQKFLFSMLQEAKVEATMADRTISNRHRMVVREAESHLRNRLQERVRGKNLVMDVIAESVLRSMNAPLDPPSRPSGVYLLSGLNSAGKMMLKRDLTEDLKLIKRKSPLLQIDLSDYLVSQSLLFGAPRGRLSRDNGKCDLSVVDAVKRWPYCVIMLDKIEKADASVYNTVLRVLDTGILSSGDGPPIDFRNTTIILTTELGNEKLISRIRGRSQQDNGYTEETVSQECSSFRSELLNRIDKIIVSNPISGNEKTFARRTMVESPPCGEDFNRGYPVYEKLGKSDPVVNLKDPVSTLLISG